MGGARKKKLGDNKCVILKVSWNSKTKGKGRPRGSSGQHAAGREDRRKRGKLREIDV